MKTQIKTRVKTILDAYRITTKEIKAKIEKWEQDTVYSADYRQEKIKELQVELKKADALFNDKMKEVIADERKVIVGEPGTRPADYEVKISNALKFLELVGDKLTDDQAYNILKPFQSDPETMQLFQGVVGNLTEGQGVWGGFIKTFEKTNHFVVLLNNLDMAEQAASNLFDSTETGLSAAVKVNMFMDSINTIDGLANGLVA